MSHKFSGIFSFLAILSLVVGDASISLRVSPSSPVVNQPSNQQFVVTCRGFGAEPPLFSNLRWYDPRGQQIDSSYSQRINPDIRAEELEVGVLLLHFQNPLEDNSGEYRCGATFQHSDSLETKIKITFFQDVQWEDCPSIQSLVLNATNERIRCKAIANPKPSITWTKDDKPLERRFQIDANGVAIHSAVRETDGGDFRVRALVTETGRLHDTFITVQIFLRPQIRGLPERFEGTENEETSLKCEAKGRPNPVFTWLDPNKRNLSSVGGYSVDRNSGTLIISRVKKVEDNGLFTCIAENNAGVDQKTTLLVVLRRPVITSFQNQSFDQNKESILECRATGDPRPLITIRRDGDSRELTTGDSRVTLEMREEKEETILRLILSQTRRQDDGLYFCRSQNRGGIVERSGHLEVRFAPDLSRTPLTSVKTWDLQPINVTCIADAIPNATVRWIFRGQYLVTDDVYTVWDNTAGISRLVINSKTTQREIFGQYKCVAINSLGESEVRIQVDRAHKPGAILQTTHEKITPTSITFRVLAPSFDGGLPILALHIQFRARDREEALESRKWPLNPTDVYFLDQLRPRTRYSIRFAAENAVGIGDWSQEREIWTERESRPEKPEFRNLPRDHNNEVVSPFSDQFMAFWTLPADNGHKIRFFELKYFSVRKTEFGFEALESQVHVNSVSMSDQSMTSFTVKSLKSNSYYKIEIRAKNDLGFSDVTSVVFKTSDGFDSEEEEMTSKASFSLALMAGLLLAIIVALLLATDAFFFCRKRVGVIYFLSENVFKSRDRKRETISAKTLSKSVEKRALRVADDPQEPFVGRASAV